MTPGCHCPRSIREARRSNSRSALSRTHNEAFRVRSGRLHGQNETSEFRIAMAAPRRARCITTRPGINGCLAWPAAGPKPATSPLSRSKHFVNGGSNEAQHDRRPLLLVMAHSGESESFGISPVTNYLPALPQSGLRTEEALLPR